MSIEEWICPSCRRVYPIDPDKATIATLTRCPHCADGLRQLAAFERSELTKEISVKNQRIALLEQKVKAAEARADRAEKLALVHIGRALDVVERLQP